MNTLAPALAKHFRVPGAEHGLPSLVTTRRLGRNVGRRTLGKVLNELGVCTGIEIGTCRAQSAIEWCEAVPGLHLTCIDPYVPYHANTEQSSLDGWYKEAKQKIGEAGYDIDLWRMSSREAADRFHDESVDFLYIDGDHTFDAVMMDLLLYVPKVRRSGVVALHDYFRSHDGGVMDAVDAYARQHATDPWYVTYDFAPTAFWQRSAEHR